MLIKLKVKTLFCILVVAGAAAMSAEDIQWIPTRIPALKYPPLGLQAQIQGKVSLRVSVDAHGAVVGIRVMSGPPVLAKAAEENMKSWRFAARCAEYPEMGGEIDFTYIFKLEAEPAATPLTDFVYEYPEKVVLTSYPQHWMPASVR